MSKAVKFFRTHPKKIIFFSGLALWGGRYIARQIDDFQMRTAYCRTLLPMSDELIYPSQKLRRVTVFLNPAAKKWKCDKLYEKNVAPFLLMSGVIVQKVSTDHSGEAKDYMSVLDAESTDAILVAGGDGTLMEVITGLLRRADFRQRFLRVPVGVVPLGKQNDSASSMFPEEKQSLVNWCYKAVRPVIDNSVKPVSMMQITSKMEDGSPRSLYSVRGLEWSICRDIQAYSARMWLFGYFREYAACLSAALRPKLTQRKAATIMYQPHCTGCSRCYVATKSESRPKGSDLGRFLGLHKNPNLSPNNSEKPTKPMDYSNIQNDECYVHEITLDAALGVNVLNKQDHLLLEIQPNSDSQWDISQACFRWRNSPRYTETNSPNTTSPEVTQIKCQWIKVVPQCLENEKFYIDNENVEAKEVEISLLRNCIYMFQ